MTTMVSISAVWPEQALHLMASGTKGQGASTITMQVARNFFLSRKKTFGRKLNEVLLAIKIEQELPER